MHELPPPAASDAHRAIPSGWYPDPVASDMLRWWDGSEWSDTEFKLAKPVWRDASRGDLFSPNPEVRIKGAIALSPFGRGASLFNAIFSVLLAAGLLTFFASKDVSLPWTFVAIACAVPASFITIAVLVRINKVPEKLLTRWKGTDYAP